MRACWVLDARGVDFANVVKLNPGDPVATPIVAKINELFAVNTEARKQDLSVQTRHRLRQQKAPELFEKIKAAIEAAKPTARSAPADGQLVPVELAIRKSRRSANLSDHFKSGQRLSLQNRPTIGTREQPQCSTLLAVVQASLIKI
jgi:hypothetical protein